MAVAIKALNARIRANPVSDYLCSTHFWGPASNFGIPIAAVMDTQKDPDIISGRMTLALSGYSAVFMRYAFAVTPRNYLLFGCHVVNFSAQMTQGYRYLNYWNFGGREKTMEERAKLGVNAGADKMNEMGHEAHEIADGAMGHAKVALEKAQGKANMIAGTIGEKAEVMVDQAKGGLRKAEGIVKDGVDKVTRN